MGTLVHDLVRRHFCHRRGPNEPGSCSAIVAGDILHFPAAQPLPSIKSTAPHYRTFRGTVISRTKDNDGSLTDHPTPRVSPFSRGLTGCAASCIASAAPSSRPTR